VDQIESKQVPESLKSSKTVKRKQQEKLK